jgi:predicted RNA polymerase sigma factor
MWELRPHTPCRPTSRRTNPDSAETHAEIARAVRAYLLERAGRPEAALESYHVAARLMTNLLEKRYFERRAGALRA